MASNDLTPTELALLTQSRAMSDLSPDQHKQMNSIFDKHGIEGDVSQAPTLGHVVAAARSLQNQNNPAATLAGEELLAMVASFHRDM